MTFPSEGLARWTAAAGGALLAVGLSLAAPPAAGAQDDAARRTVTVKEGDTLWSLAARHLGSGGQWRRLYRANQDRLESPERLVPGVELVLPGGGEAGGREASRQEPARRPRPGESLFGRGDRLELGELSVASSAPRSRVSATEYVRAPFLAGRDVVGTAARTVRLRGEASAPVDHDRSLPVSVRERRTVLLASGGLELEPGDGLQAVRPGDRVRGHGRIVRPVATLEVVAVRGDSAVARVEQRFGLYRVGDPVLPLPAPPDLRGGDFVSVEDGPTARLLVDARDRPLMTPGSVLFVAAGSADGVRPGDEFEVRSRDGGDEDGGAPGARLRVVRTGTRSSTVRVVSAREPRLALRLEARLVRRLVAGGEG